MQVFLRAQEETHMDEETFLVLLHKHGKYWELDQGGRIRRGAGWSDNCCDECPLTALANAEKGRKLFSAQWMQGGRALRLNPLTIIRIVNAADCSEPYDRRLRRKLLIATGLLK
jgi:hypothetical protein